MQILCSKHNSQIILSYNVLYGVNSTYATALEKTKWPHLDWSWNTSCTESRERHLLRWCIACEWQCISSYCSHSDMRNPNFPFLVKMLPSHTHPTLVVILHAFVVVSIKCPCLALLDFEHCDWLGTLSDHLLLILMFCKTIKVCDCYNGRHNTVKSIYNKLPYLRQSHSSVTSYLYLRGSQFQFPPTN